MSYDSDFVTLHGEMLKQVRNAVSRLAVCNCTDFPQDVQHSIRVLTGDFAYRIGANITDNRKNQDGK